jgi:glycosyltransferase involved in cell wall biosynthesis
MALNIINDTDTVELGPSKDGTYEGAMGGTELMNKALHERVDKGLLEEFNLIKSRVRWVDPKKKNLLWLHDTWDDPESQHLKKEESRSRFEKLIFVSNYQFQTYHLAHKVPYDKSAVLKNAIEPIQLTRDSKGKDQIRLIYHTTPHRGLALLVPCVAKLAEIYGDRIHLDVYSSFEAYGWAERDEPFNQLFDAIRNHPQMTYHGYQPNEVVREALTKAHIFAYPNIWPETSCIAAIEAMSAGCEVVCPNHAALPETTGNFATMYQMTENHEKHANVFVNQLYAAIERWFDENSQRKRVIQQNWVNNFYNWDLRAAEWNDLLRELSNGSN